MEFILKDKPLVIKSAELFATIQGPQRQRRSWWGRTQPADDPRPFWTLEVWAEGEFDEMFYTARAMAEEMRFPIRRWVDVAGQTVEWARPYGAKVGGPYGTFYLEEHEMIGRARLRFGERQGDAFRFEWEGVCDAYLDSEYGRDVPFQTSGWARFTGVTVGGGGLGTDEYVRERLAQYFDPHDFVQGELIRRDYRHGFFRRFKSSYAVFTPSETSAGG